MRKTFLAYVWQFCISTQIKVNVHCESFAHIAVKQPLILIFSCIAISLPALAQNKVSVHVLDSNQKPLPNASIALRVWGEKKWRQETLHADATGSATFSLEKPIDPKRPAGNLVVYAKGFALDGSPINSNSLDFKLQPGATWRGQVVDKKGQPIAGAKVSASLFRKKAAARDEYLSLDGEEIQQTYTATSSADGTFQLADVPVGGTVSYQVVKSGFATESGKEPASVAETASIALGPEAKIHGKLLGTDGKPMKKTLMYARTMEIGEGYGNATTGDDGTYTIEGLSPGDYRVGVMESDFNPYIITPLQHIMAEVEKTTEVPDLRAVEGIMVSGFVREKNTGKPVIGASITANKVGVREDYTSSNATGEDGRFSVRVLPGNVRFYTNGVPEGYIGHSEQILQVGDKAPAALTFELQKAPILTGTIVDENNRPVKAQLELWGGGFDDRIIASDAQGRWSWQANSNADLQVSGGEDDSGYFKILNNKAYPIQSDTPIVFKVKKQPWRSLEGRIVTRGNKPLAGVEVTASYFVKAGDDGAINQATRKATTDANGHYVFTRIRAAEDLSGNIESIKINASPKGMVFVSGGTLTQKDGNWAADDLVLASLNRRIEGQTEADARVVAAGKETRADDKGHFVLEGLPEGEFLVSSAKDGKFGNAIAADTAAPIRLELKPIKAQDVDVEAGLSTWRDVARDGVEAKFYALDWLNWQLAAPKGDTFESLKRADDGPTTIMNDRILSSRIAKFAPQLPKENRVARLEELIKGINSPEIRLSAWLGAAKKIDDPEVGKRALKEADTVLQSTPPEFGWRENNLYNIAVVTEKVQGTDKGIEALNRAMKVTLARHPEKPARENGRQSEITRDQMLRFQAEVVAEGSKTMLRQLLDTIDPESGENVQAYSAAIPVVAQTHGIEEALLLLEELVKLPKPETREGQRSLNGDPQWAFNQAARRLIPLLGKKSPQQAVELANRITDQSRAAAWSAAAQFQTPEAAAKLWRDAVQNAEVPDAPRFAAQAWERDHKLGAEMFALARQKAQTASEARFVSSNPWPSYAFYFARVDPAAARLELERTWGEQLLKTGSDGASLTKIAMAMSAVDGKRALEMANAIPKGSDNFWPLHTRVKIAQYLMASPELRRDFPFARWGATDTWQPGDEDW